MNKLLTFFCLCSTSTWGIAQTTTGKAVHSIGGETETQQAVFQYR